MAGELTGTGPIKRGVVRLIRSNGPFEPPLRGGIHERLASKREKYPFIVYSAVSAPFVRDNGTAVDGGTREIRMLMDISVLASNQVDADNIDSTLDRLFSDQEEALGALVDGQTVILCHRVGDTPAGPDRDEEGRYYVQKGGTYEIWTVQPIPLPGP